MKVTRIESVESAPVAMEGASGVTKRVMIGPDDGAPNFVMRVFTVEPGGHTPLHSHDSEHEVYVVGGRGAVVEGETGMVVPIGDVTEIGMAVMKLLRMEPEKRQSMGRFGRHVCAGKFHICDSMRRHFMAYTEAINAD